MAKRPDERRRLLKELKARDRELAEKELPVPKGLLLSLFDRLDRSLSVDPCDHSLRFTIAWCQDQHVDPDRISEWVKTHGGYCDCEVLANVPASNPALQN